MKWKEFKEQLEKQGIKDDDDILYIDCYPDENLHLTRAANVINLERYIYIE